jgi:hypothetical protein
MQRLTSKSCEQCEKAFEAKRKCLRFCSRSCSAQWCVKNFPPSVTRFKAGEPSWNKGTNNSGMKDKFHSRETKDKMRESHLGELSASWKGGLTEINYRIRRSEQYADWRKAVFKRDDYRCGHCGDRSESGNRVRLEADHIKPFAMFPELRFDISNGMTLCAPCHRRTPTWGVSTTKQATLESNGKPFISLKKAA